MSISVRLATIAVVAAAAAFAANHANAASAVREPGGAIRFYDDNGFDRGYAWCANRGGRAWASSSDCSFFTWAQCRAAMFQPPDGDCIPNPWASQVTTPPMQPRRRR